MHVYYRPTVPNKRFFTKSCLLSASWRSCTQKYYSGKFKQLSIWCRGKQIDLYSASVTDCAEFLTFLFRKGLQYRTIAGYRSMVSSVLHPVNNFSVGQHPYIVRLIKGIFNSKIVSEYDQEIPQSQTADNPVAPRGRAAQPSRDTRKTN